VYLIRASATDEAGNTGYDCCTVTVPHSPSAADVSSVTMHAVAAEATCDPAGAIPVGFIPVGDGPIFGPKQ